MRNSLSETGDRTGLKIIGCGNPDRGDDAAGILVTRRLREWGLDAHDANSLFDLWEPDDDVVVVDAMSSGREVGAVAVWEGDELPDIQVFRTSTHGFGIVEAIQLAKVLKRMPRRLRVYAIEGRQFGIGSELSPGVAEAVDAVSVMIAEEVSILLRQSLRPQ